MSEIDDLQTQLTKTTLAYQTAVQNNQIKTAFLGRIAHEIRSPLSSMISLHQLIIHDLCDNLDEERECITQANEYARKLVGMIDRLIEISQLEVGKIDLEITSFNLVELLEDIYQIIELEAKNKNIHLKFKNKVDNLIIETDKVRLTNLIFYILEAVIDMSETGVINIDLSDDKNLQQYRLNISFLSHDFSLNESEEIKDTSLSPEELKRLQTLPEFSPQMKISLVQSLLRMLGGNLQLKQSNSDEILSKELHLLLQFVTVVPQNHQS